MPRLTERRHLQTRTEIAAAAIALFTKHGFDETTMADVAEASGVSRRTVYRHFPTKDDLVFEYPRRWIEQFQLEMATREPNESLRQLSRRVLLSLAASIENDREPILAAFAVLQSTDALRGKHGRTDDEWINLYIAKLAGEPGFTPELLAPISVVAAATVAGTNTAIALWALGQPETDLTAITASVLDQLDPIWPDAFH